MIAAGPEPGGALLNGLSQHGKRGVVLTLQGGPDVHGATSSRPMRSVCLPDAPESLSLPSGLRE
jgi:hypothetical protein